MPLRADFLKQLGCLTVRALRAEVRDERVLRPCNGNRIGTGAAPSAAVCNAHPARLRAAILRRVHGHAARKAARPGHRVCAPVLRHSKGALLCASVLAQGFQQEVSDALTSLALP